MNVEEFKDKLRKYQKNFLKNLLPHPSGWGLVGDFPDSEIFRLIKELPHHKWCGFSQVPWHKKEDIIITDHADLQAYIRQIDIEEVKSNIISPEKLVHATKQESKNIKEDKYECYFAYSEYYCHKYIMKLNRKVIIVTIISINRRWQGMVGK